MSASGLTDAEAREALQEKYTTNSLDKHMGRYDPSLNKLKDDFYKNIIPTFTNDMLNDLETQIDTLFEIAQMMHGDEPMNVGQFVEYLEEEFQPEYIDFLYYARKAEPLNTLEELKGEILLGQEELLQQYINGVKGGRRRKTQKRKAKKRKTRKSRK